MTTAKTLPALTAAVLIAAMPARADVKSLFESLTRGATGDQAAPSAGALALSDDEVVGGLKEALAKGAEKAIDALGRPDGFLGDERVRIPLPENLEKVASALRALRQDRYADDFELTMNRAAESAVPEAGAIVGDAIRQMTVDDAQQILQGPDDAATRYFRTVGEARLIERMLPIVQEATSRAGVTSAYKGLMDNAGFAARLVGSETPDLDRYVTDKTLDGLFLMIAAEEKRIRENPVARSTDLLKKVFGSVTR